jgi:MGT family glycosyltransferase
MAAIIILVDSEAGHILPTSKTALELKRRNHNVYYAGFAGGESIVRRQGYDFFPVLEGKLDESGTAHFGPLVRGEALDDLFSKLNPDVVLLSSLFTLEGLAIKYRYQIPAVLFRTDFSPISRENRSKIVVDRLNEFKDGREEFLEVLSRSGVRIDSIEDVSNLAGKIPELVFLPKGFESPHNDNSPYLYYLGPSVDIRRQEEEFNWDQVDSRPVVYASFGSQSHQCPELITQWHQSLIRAFSTMPEYNLILNVGRSGLSGDVMPVPENIFIRSYVPQMDVLRRAAMMINHAGIGSVKECIVLGVPMILSPLMRDQFMCAQRVAEHGLGKVASLSEMTEQQIVDLIRSTIDDYDAKTRIQAMRDIFNRAENLELGISVIESAIENGY